MKAKHRTIDGELFLNTAAAANLAEVSEQYIRELSYKGVLNRTKVDGRSNWYKESDIQAHFGVILQAEPPEQLETETIEAKTLDNGDTDHIDYAAAI